MESSILNSIGIDPGIIVIVMMGIMIFVLLYMVRVSMKMTRFMKRYRIFMKGKDAVSLEKAFCTAIYGGRPFERADKNQHG